jgi:hypothetical protein
MTNNQIDRWLCKNHLSLLKEAQNIMPNFIKIHPTGAAVKQVEGRN